MTWEPYLGTRLCRRPVPFLLPLVAARLPVFTMIAGCQHSKLSFPCGSAGEESACNAGDLGSIPGLGRFPGEGKGYPLQYSGLENSMDCIVHGVAEFDKT